MVHPAPAHGQGIEQASHALMIDEALGALRGMRHAPAPVAEKARLDFGHLRAHHGIAPLPGGFAWMRSIPPAVHVEQRTQPPR